MAVFFAIRAGLAYVKRLASHLISATLLLIRKSARRLASRRSGKVSAKYSCWPGAGRRLPDYIELRFVYVGEALIVAFILAFVPYLVLRGYFHAHC